MALGYLGFPVLYLVFAGLLFDVPGSGLANLLLSPGYFVLSALAVFCGYGFWEMKRWSWPLFLLTNLLIGYENAVVVATYGQTHHVWLSFLFSLLVILLITLRVTREVRVPYFLPRIRWWESNPNFRLSVSSQFGKERRRGSSPEPDGGHDKTYQADILDLSMNGCFLKSQEDMALDQGVWVKFTLFGVAFHCPGVVVWKAHSAVTHPKGLGVKFGAMPRSEKRLLRLVDLRLRRISRFYRTNRYWLSNEDFAARMHELQSRPVTDSKSEKKVIREFKKKTAGHV